MADPCIVCAQNTEAKPKPGVFPCLGCKQMFCTQHVTFHRQELANEFDLVIGNRNELQEILDRRQNIPDVSAQMNLIDEWVKKTVEQVYQIADNVRQQINHLAEEQKMNLKDQFAELSKELDTFRENENFYEKDIQNLKEKCIRLKRFLDPVDVHVIVADISSSLAQAVTLQQREEKSVKTPLSFIENLVQNQKPTKQIQIPHNGSVYIGNEVVLIRNDDNFTTIDLKTNSLQSIRLVNSRNLVLCWSTYLNGLLCANPQANSKIGLLCANPQANSKIGLLKVMGRNMETVHEFRDAIEMVSYMVCRLDRMMLVCRGTDYNNRVEEWSLKDFEHNEKRTTTPIHCWQPSLTCASDEIVVSILFNDEQIVLLITTAKSPSKSRIEFRTRNMYTIGQLPLNYDEKFPPLLCCLNDGWLLGDRKQTNSPWHFTLIDNKLKQHEQKFLSNYGIVKIEAVKNSANESTIAIYREEGRVNTLTYDRSKLFLDLYRI